MNKYPNWDWSIVDVKRFIAATKASGYHFKILLLSGGEPLLWKKIIPATRLLKESGIADCIKMLTNSCAVNSSNLKWFKDVIENIDNVRISKYIGNERSVELIQKNFGHLYKIHISDKTDFMVQTRTPVKDSLPADCACNYPTVFGDQIDICGGSRFQGLYNGTNTEKSFTVPVKKGYLDYFDKVEGKYMQDACQYCMVNRKVLSVLKSEKNHCKKGV